MLALYINQRKRRRGELSPLKQTHRPNVCSSTLRTIQTRVRYIKRLNDSDSHSTLARIQFTTPYYPINPTYNIIPKTVKCVSVKQLMKKRNSAMIDYHDTCPKICPNIHSLRETHSFIKVDVFHHSPM